MSLSLSKATLRRRENRRISKEPRVSISTWKHQSRYSLIKPVASAIQRTIMEEIHPQFQQARHAEQRQRSHQEHNGPLKAMLGEMTIRLIHRRENLLTWNADNRRRFYYKYISVHAFTVERPGKD
jgi:hypothetical protein